MELLTVLTPTYNRGHLLHCLYESLEGQTNRNFLWMIIDDGSTDDTEEIVKGFCQKSTFRIIYKKQKNGGKHRALNNGLQQVASELVIIVDSDDILTYDAVDVIEEKWKTIDDDSIAYMSFLRGYSDGKVIGDYYPDDRIVSNHIDYCINGRIQGDKAEVFRASIIREFCFPEIEGEKFIGEGVVWNRIGKKYKSIYYNNIIYITEYLEGGLTKSGLAMRLKNPIGGMLYANECLTKEYLWLIRVKHAILYDLYRRYAGVNKNVVPSNAPWLTFLCNPIASLYNIYVKKVRK